jgi:hypothetical protein
MSRSWLLIFVFAVGCRGAVPVSTCSSGLQDHDGDGVCLPTCADSKLSCGTHGVCDDSDGVAACSCSAGYQGEDCSSCAAGFQDNDGDGVCVADCATAVISCGQGSCGDSTGEPSCSCSGGYGGADCVACAAGYQDNDTNGTCLSSCATASVNCGSNGHCSDVAGTAACVCASGYQGANCTTCAAGYQDNDTNGTCEPTCASSGLGCGHGTCSDSTGTAACTCSAGYGGADCQACAAEYQDNDDNGTCLASCVQVQSSCGAHGTCFDVTGTATCTCAAGYQGAACDQCANGYSDEDGDGTCSPPCGTSTWFDNAYAYRANIQITNDAGTDLPAMVGSEIQLDHAALVAASRSLANGDDLRVVYDDGISIGEIPRVLTSPNTATTKIGIQLRAAIADGGVDGDYWLYWGNSSATNPPVGDPIVARPAVRDSDPSKTLSCNPRDGSFYSLQLRQIGENEYRAHLFDMTFDSSAYARMVITDSVGAVIKDTTYGDYGTYSSHGRFDEDFTLNATSFTVTIESREFSSSQRFLGCHGDYSGNSVLGTTSHAYSIPSSDLLGSAAFCGR